MTLVRAKGSFFAHEAILACEWLPIPWLYAPEIMPLLHRTHSAALATARDWTFDYMTVQITPISIANIRWTAIMIFFVLNIFFAVLVWLLYPEITGRTVVDIDQLCSGGCDRLFVVDKRGLLLPGFRSTMGQQRDTDPMVDYDSSTSSTSHGISGEKVPFHYRGRGV